MSQPAASLSVVEFAESHHKIPALIVSGTRCGRPNCRCATSDYRHRTACLYWRDGFGHPRRRYVRKAEIDQVRAIIESRRTARLEWRRALAESTSRLRELRIWLRDTERLGREAGWW